VALKWLATVSPFHNILGGSNITLKLLIMRFILQIQKTLVGCLSNTIPGGHMVTGTVSLQ
jgi:hypothetical protein